MAKQCIVFYIDDSNDYSDDKAVFECTLNGFEKAKKYVVKVMHDRENYDNWENFSWSRDSFERFMSCGCSSLNDDDCVYYCLQKCDFFLDNKLEVE